MSRYREFLAMRRAQRREEWRRGARQVAAWLLTFVLGASVGWFGRDWREMNAAMRRPDSAAQAPESAGQDGLSGPGLSTADVIPPGATTTRRPGGEDPPEGPEAGVDRRDPGETDEAQPALTGSLRERLSTLARTAPGPSSIWFYDLTSNESVSVRGDKLYTAASTTKVPIVMYLYHLAANNRLSLDRRVSVQEEDWAAGTGILQGVPEGKRYSLRDLARLAIVHSDNIATNTLLRTLGNPEVESYLREIGIRHDREQNLISARDLGLAFRHLWRMARRYPVPWEEPLAFLRQTMFNDRLPAGVPEGVDVAHKIGSVELAFHDAGIIYHPTRPYILVVMTDGMGEKAAARYISRVSREAWRWQAAAP